MWYSSTDFKAILFSKISRKIDFINSLSFPYNITIGDP